MSTESIEVDGKVYVLANPAAGCDPDCVWCKSQSGPRQFPCDGYCCWPGIETVPLHAYKGRGGDYRCDEKVMRRFEDDPAVLAQCRWHRLSPVHREELAN